MIVVGKVCALADRFAWYEELPLAGRRIVVTRPKELISRMASMLREKGAEVLELPAIRTVAQEPGGALDAALDELRQYQWLVFTSPMGVRIFFRAMERLKMDLRALGGAKIAAIGTGTEKELNARGLYADLIPETFDGEGLRPCTGGPAQRGRPGADSTGGSGKSGAYPHSRGGARRAYRRCGFVPYGI